MNFFAQPCTWQSRTSAPAPTRFKKRFVSRFVEKFRAFIVGFSRDGRELNGKNGSVVAALVRPSISLFSPTVALTKFKLQASLAAVATKRDPDFERVSEGWLETRMHTKQKRGAFPGQIPLEHPAAHTAASQIVTNRHYREPAAAAAGAPLFQARMPTRPWRDPGG